MAETNANIRIGVDTSDALVQIKNLQRQISQFHTQMAAGGKAAAEQASRMQSSLMKSINATGAFSAQMTTVKTSTESFTNALEKNKLSIGQTFRFAGGATRSFGRLFRSEFNTINKVAEERVKDLQTQYIKLGRNASGAMEAIKIRPKVLDMQNFGTQTAIAAQRQQLFNQLIRQGSTNLLNWGKNTQWAGRQLMVGFTVPLTIFGGIAIREFQKIEEQAIKFRRVYGDMFTSTKETEKALSDIRQLADEFTKFGIAVESTVDLAAKVAQMGNVGEALEAQVRQATRLSILGGMEQQEALDTTIGLTNAFGLSIEDLTEKVNFLNAAENQTILAIQDFNTAVPLAGSVVQQLGGSVEDLAFFLTAMREGGINASQGANALKSSLARLISPTKAAQERLADMGINVLGIVESNAGDLRGTVQQLGFALNELDPLSRARAIETLFGRFQFARMSTLFQNIVDEGSQANKVLQLTTNSAEELAILADRELGRVEESAATRLSKSMEEIKAALAPIGEAFVELVVPILNVVRDMVKRFDNMGDAGKKVFLGFVAVLGVIAPALLMVVGLIANGLANIMLFGSKLMSIFGKSKNSSKLLTDQFTYMNSEQIEAAAIAASLNQVHTDLTQTFNAETTAVELLARAYDKVISRQEAMMAGRPVGAPGAAPTKAGGTGGKVPGYADGIVSVPGPKGKGDIVPAMLSPGEAVIPTEQSQKYSALIKGIIADNIPGFARGRDDTHFAHLGGGKDRSIKELLDDPNFKPSRAVRQRLEETLILDPKATASTKHSWGVKMDAGTNIRLDPVNPKTGQVTGSGAGIDEVAKQFTGQNIEDRYGEVFSLTGADRGDTELQKQFANYDKAMSKKMKDLQKTGITSIVDTEEQWKKLPKAQQETTRSLESIDKEVTKEIGKENKKLLATRKKSLGTMRDVRIGPKNVSPEAVERAKKEPRFKGLVRKRGGGSDAIRFGYSKKIGGEGAPMAGPAATPRSAELAKEEQAKKAAPKRARKAATETVESYVGGLEEGKKKARASGKKGGRQLSDKPENVRRRELYAEKKRKRELASQQRQRDHGTSGPITPEMRWKKKAAQARQAQLKRELAQAKSETQLLQQKQRITQGQQNEVKKQGLVARLQERMLQRKQQRLTREQQMAVQETAQQIPRRGMGMGGAGMIGMAASSAMMMGSFAPGKIGEAAGKMFPAMMMVSMALPLMQSGIGLVVVALAALAAGIFFLNKSFTDAMKEGEALAKSFGAGKESMDAFAEAAGKVTASQIMDRRREEQAQGFRIQPGKSTFGETFLEGDMGSQMLENLKKTVEQTGSLDAVKSAVVNQIGTAVATGALDAGQARSIVATLASELGDYRFGIEVNGQLLSMFGPDGTDILNDPLVLRMRLMEETRGQIEAAGERLSSAGDATTERNLGRGAVVGGSALAGAALNKPITALATKMLPGVVARMGVSAAIGSAVPVLGTVAGLLVGAGLAAWDIVKFNKDLGQAAGGVVATGALALQQNQQLLDSLEIEYERRIQIAKEAGDTAEAARLENQYLEDRQSLLEGNSETMDAILQTYREASTGFLGIGNERKALDTAMDQQLAKLYEDEPLVQAFLDQTMRDVQDSVSGELAYQIKVSLLSKDISPTVVSQLLATFQDDEESIQRAMNVVTNLGTADGNLALQIMNMFETPEQSARFLANLEVKDPNDAKEYVELFQEISKIGEIQDLEVVMAYYLDNPQEADKLQRDLDRIREIAKEDVTLDVYASIFTDPEAQRALMSYVDEFENMQPEYRADFVQAFRTIYETIELTPGALENWRRETGRSDATASDMAAAQALRLTQSRMGAGVMAELEPDEDLGGGGGGGPQASPLDELLKKLRDLRKAQIEVTKGWVESRNAIDRLFGGGQEIKVFEGIEQQMRRLGAGEDLISLIVGMDPDDFERRKNELFVFDAAGNIAGATTALVNMGKALRAVALGEFQSEQQRVVQGLNEQMIAFRKLTAAGLSAAQAYEAVKNAAFAAAVAREKDNNVIKETIRLTKQAIELQRAFDAAQSLARRNEQAGDLRGVVSFIERNAKSLTEAQKSAILSDPELQTLIMNPRVDPKTLREALKNAANQADLDLRIEKLTFEGLTSIFQRGFSNAMEAFATKEREIEIAFNLKKDPFLKIIQAAEEEISDIRNREGGLDDLEAELTRISRQEEDINKAYDRRIEALDRIDKINEQINRQKKSQLDVADALSRGDIAGAARAAQEARKEAAEAAQKERRDQLEAARQSDLARITGRTGLTREDIEKRIRDLQFEIFNIEEDRLEPAQRQVELLERERASLAESLTVLGKTKNEWEAIENQVALAKISSDDFKKSMQDALDVVEDIVNYWDNFENKEVDLFVNVRGMGALEELLAIAEAGPPTPDPGGGGGGSTEPDLDRFTGQPIASTMGRQQGSLLDSMRTPITPGPGFFRQVERADMASFEASEAEKALAEQNDRIRAAGGEDKVHPDALAYRDELAAAADEARRIADNLQAGVAATKTSLDLGDPFAIYNRGAVNLADATANLFRGIAEGAEWALGQNMGRYFADLGIQVPTLLGTFPTLFERMSEAVRAPIQEGIVGHFATMAANVPSAIRSIPEVFQNMPEGVRESLEGGIGGIFEELGVTIPADLDNIQDWFFTLPGNVQDQVSELISAEFLNIGNQAVSDLEGTISQYWEVLPGDVKDAIEGEIGVHIEAEAAAAGMSIEEYITKAFIDMPEETRQAIEEQLAGQFVNMSMSALQAIAQPGSAIAAMGDTIAPATAKAISNALRGAALSSETDFKQVQDFIASIPEGQNVVQALRREFPGLIEEGAKAAEENLETIPDAIAGIPTDRQVENAINGSGPGSLPHLFGQGGTSSGAAFGSNAVSRIATAISNYRPATITIPVQYKVDQNAGGFVYGGVPKLGLNSGGMVPGYAIGGKVKGYARGGMIKGYANGGRIPMNRVVPGTANYDKVDARLTPGEFVIRKEAVQKYGKGFFAALNDTVYDTVPRVSAPSFNTSNMSTTGVKTSDKDTKPVVYNNYSVSVNVKSEADPDRIARTVTDQIKRVESQKIRGNRF